MGKENSVITSSNIKREDKLIKLVCQVAKPNSISMQLLLDRLKRNEDTHQSTFVFSKYVWRSKKPIIDPSMQDISSNDENLMMMRALRRKRRSTKLARFEDINNEENQQQQKKLVPIELFRIIARRVRLLIRVFRNMHQYALEKGGHGRISTGAMQLKDSVVNDSEEKNLLFDPNDYKSRYQFSIPYWARQICAQLPENRNDAEVQNIVSLMRQLKAFRKYSNRMQTLLAKIVRYERFGRRRVVIRKGHVGMSFYLIFSGTVGVVIKGDEDAAFANEEKPANMLQKGDAFGEIALVRRSVRSATIVCLENTEFLVIDKEDFYKLGIDKCAEEEMLFRYDFMRQMEMFSTWNDSNLKEVAEGGRIIQYLTDQVIEMDTTETEFVYIISKGQCDVLRLLDLTAQNFEETKNQANAKYTKLRNHSPTSSSGYHGSRTSSSTVISKHYTDRKESSVDLSFYNDSQRKLKTSLSKKRISSKLSVSDRKNICNSDTYSLESIESLSNRAESKTSSRTQQRYTRSKTSCNSTAYKKQQQQQQQQQEQSMPTVVGKVSDVDFVINSDLGLGVLIKVDVLTQGQIFGIKSILHEDEQDRDSTRKFTLVSAGCDVIRVPKSVLKTYADKITIDKISEQAFTYDTDRMLYRRFKRYNTWRCFREQLVDHIAQCETQMQRSLKNRCKVIPRITRITEIANLARPETPIEQWQRLVVEGSIVKTTPPGSPTHFNVSPTLQDDNRSASLTTPFVQDRILTAKGYERRLVLTHGGSRVNKLQASTKCSLIRQKEAAYQLNKRFIE